MSTPITRKGEAGQAGNPGQFAAKTHAEADDSVGFQDPTVMDLSALEGDRGVFAEGYTSEDIDDLNERLDGIEVIAVWEDTDDDGYHGDSELLVRGSDGVERTMPETLWEHLHESESNVDLSQIDLDSVECLTYTGDEFSNEVNFNRTWRRDFTSEEVMPHRGDHKLRRSELLYLADERDAEATAFADRAEHTQRPEDHHAARSARLDAERLRQDALRGVSVKTAITDREALPRGRLAPALTPSIGPALAQRLDEVADKHKNGEPLTDDDLEDIEVADKLKQAIDGSHGQASDFLTGSGQPKRVSVDDLTFRGGVEYSSAHDIARDLDSAYQSWHDSTLLGPADRRSENQRAWVRLLADGLIQNRTH